MGGAGSVTDTPPPCTATEDFLAALYDGAPEAYLCLFTLPGSDCLWLRADDVPRIATAARRLSAEKETYFGIGLHPAARGAHNRGEASGVSVLPGLWVDIDIQHPCHTKQNLPPTREAVLALVARFPYPPTWIVMSGHGIHAWWLFREPWHLETPAENREAARLARRFVRWFQREAREKGWHIDPTADLARVLRLPGTWNRKVPGEVVAVETLHGDSSRRYGADDFDMVLPEVEEYGVAWEPKTGDAAPVPLGPIVAGCAFMRHCRDDAKTLSEPEWYSALTILARCQQGGRLAHDWSKPYPRYDREATERKLVHATTATGPRTCAGIRYDLDGERHCSACAHWGRIKSPIVLGMGGGDRPPLPGDEDAPPPPGEARRVDHAERALEADRRANGFRQDLLSLNSAVSQNGHSHEKGLLSLSSLMSQVEWPTPLADEAYHGIAGVVTRTIAPDTEADPAVILTNFLVAMGNLLGRGPHARVGATYHYLNLFKVDVGRSSKGRKGTGLDPIRALLGRVEEHWEKNQVTGGLSSGEGLIHNVRDPVTKRVAIRDAKSRRATGKYEDAVEDAGVQDKRLLLLETEFASVLKIMAREGNTLSPVLRQAWDSGTLRTLVKNSPGRAHDAHVSLIGHIPQQELLKHLNDTESANGFGNRILWVCARRSQLLPEGGNPPLDELALALQEVVARARAISYVARSQAARLLWSEVYPSLSREVPGMFGAVIGRAEAQVLRLSTLYAVMDGMSVIAVPHLLAALAVWDYSERSARYIFGESTGNNVGDTILAAVKSKPQGITRTEIRDLFDRHATAREVDEALTQLQSQRLLAVENKPTGGRPVHVYTLVSLVPHTHACESENSKLMLDSAGTLQYARELSLELNESLDCDISDISDISPDPCLQTEEDVAEISDQSPEEGEPLDMEWFQAVKDSPPPEREWRGAL